MRELVLPSRGAFLKRRILGFRMGRFPPEERHYHRVEPCKTTQHGSSMGQSLQLKGLEWLSLVSCDDVWCFVGCQAVCNEGDAWWCLRVHKIRKPDLNTGAMCGGLAAPWFGLGGWHIRIR